MGRKLKQLVQASWLAQELGLTLHGSDRMIERVDAADAADATSLCFAKNVAWVAKSYSAAVVLCHHDHVADIATSALPSTTPRLDFARALSLLDARVGFVWSAERPQVHPTARIGQHAVIGPGVRIGAHTVIGHHVVIGAEVEIGERCNIKSGAVIGEEGFGFERDASGAAVRLPHIGTVRIGNDVEVGSLTTVCRGTLADTVLQDGAKIDDHVHIAHNISVGEHAFVIACAEVSGGVRIGKRAWIAPSATVLNQLTIGDDAVVGLGAVVVRNVEAGDTVVGNPAKPLTRKN
jgi:UDP-3-O-[3-hydroxymyristoyl] glucosamine N-acyltransferase LpxD